MNVYKELMEDNFVVKKKYKNIKKQKKKQDPSNQAIQFEW